MSDKLESVASSLSFSDNYTSSTSHSPATSHTKKNGSKEAILIVDDNQLVLKGLQNTLKQDGYNITATASGVEAIVALKEGDFDLVLTDIVMNEGSGFAILKHARATVSSPAVIMITGYGSTASAVAAMQVGAADYITKPCNDDELKIRIRRALEQRRARMRKQQMVEEVARYATDLAEKNKELEALLHTVSHDLRNPLITIAGFANILHRNYADGLDQRARNCLDILISSTKRMSGLVTDLLDLARVEGPCTGTGEVDMLELVSTTIEDLRYQWETIGAKIEVDDKLPPTVGRAGDLHRLWMNLIANALQYGKPGEPGHVRISGIEFGEQVQYSVADNGIGISEEHHRKIFQIFHRLDTSHPVEGTGMGLAIAKRIVEHHGGQIWVESEQGIGTTFFFSLPSIPQS